MDVMHSIIHIYKRKIMEAKGIHQKTLNQLKGGVGADFLIDEELNISMQLDKTSLTMDKLLIIEAWSRYRPSSQENSPKSAQKDQHINLGRHQNRDIFLIYGEPFVNRLVN